MLALRIIDNELRARNVALYKIEHIHLTEPGTVKLSESQFAVTDMMEAKTADTDFSVSLTSDSDCMEWTETNCQFDGVTQSNLDIYKSNAALLLKGNFSVEVEGTPSPAFFLSYIKITILESNEADTD